MYEAGNDTTDKRGNLEYWLRWLPAAKKAAKDHWLDTKAAWKEYEDEYNSEQVAGEASFGDTSKRLCPLYWSSCQTVESAYYSKTPKLRARRRFDIDDQSALTGALIAERLGEYLVENSHFDAVMRQSVGGFIHSAKVTTQICYHPIKGMQQKEVIGADGLPTVVEEEVILDHKITLKAVCHDEILHTPEAKGQDEITEIAYYFCMDEAEARARFKGENGEDLQLPWKTSKDYERKSGEEDRSDLPGKYLEGWEIYDFPNNKVYWVNENYKEGFLDVQDDPYGFRHFYPSPRFVIANKPEKSLYPRPAYVRLQALLNSLHDLYAKRFDLIDKIRRRALVDAENTDLIHALNSLESGEYIALKNFRTILEKGGIENAVLWVPLQELVTAISEINSLEQEFKNAFFEYFGLPDILRGVSDPQEALGTQQIKSTAAHDRFKNHKKQIQELARDSIEMMLDLALQVMPAEKIWRVCGMDFAPKEHKDRFIEALEFLKNDEERLIRVDIETDSTSFLDAQAELFKRRSISETVINGLATIGGMQNLEFASVALRTLLSTISGLDGSKEYEDGVMSAVRELMEKKSQPQEPPPDVKLLQVQVQQQKVANEAQAKQRELELKEYKLMEEQKQSSFDRQLEVFKAEMERQMQQFLQMAESARLELEEVKVALTEREKLIEEQRLAMEAMQASMAPPEPREAPSPQIIQVSPPEMPAINITVDAKSSGKKLGKIVRNPLTGEAAFEMSDAPEPIIAA